MQARVHMAVQKTQKRQISGARTHCWFWAERKHWVSLTLYDSFTYWESKSKLSVCRSFSIQGDHWHLSHWIFMHFFLIAHLCEPKRLLLKWSFKSPEHLSEKPKSGNCNLYSAVNLQMFCKSIFSEDKNMTHFTFQSQQQKWNILDSFSKLTYLAFMFSVLLLFLFGKIREIRSLLSAHPDFDTNPY